MPLLPVFYCTMPVRRSIVQQHRQASLSGCFSNSFRIFVHNPIITASDSRCCNGKVRASKKFIVLIPDCLVHRFPKYDIL